MKSSIIIGGLVVALLGSTYWGYTEYAKKENVMIQAENNYQRAYNNLTYNVDLLHDKLGTTLAMNSRTSLSPALADVWRLSTESQSDIGQLPLRLLPFNKTQEFLTDVGNFSYHTAVRDLDKQPLTDQEYSYLQSIYNKSEGIQNDLRTVQYRIIQNNLSWMDVEQVLSSKNTPQDNVIIDGIQAVEMSNKAYTKENFGPTTTDLQKDVKGLKNIHGKKISANEAKNTATSFLGLDKNAKITVQKSLKGAEVPFYILTIQNPKLQSETYMNITETGGYPVLFITSRPMQKQKISLDEAVGKAKKFLQDKKFKNMELIESSQYDTMGVLTFVPNINKIRIYPDSVQLKVALDDGSILGYNAKNYLISHHKRTIHPPSLTVEEARKKMSKKVTIQEERLAIISNDFNKEVLCYEFVGTLGNDTYDIFVNANNGTEEKVKKLQNIEQMYE
jgi:spore germination protein